MDERALTTRSPAQVARTTLIVSVVALGVVVVAVLPEQAVLVVLRVTDTG